MDVVEKVLMFYKIFGLIAFLGSIAIGWLLWKWISPELKKADKYFEDKAEQERKIRELKIKKLEKELDDMDS